VPKGKQRAVYFLGYAMADTIEIDLPTLKRILQDGFELGFGSLQGCTAQVSIGPEMLAALLAEDFCGLDSIVGP
jgi:hypothetical protein